MPITLHDFVRKWNASLLDERQGRATNSAAVDLLRLTERLEMEKPHAPERPSKLDVGHFMMRLVFCLFADSVGILPNGTFRPPKKVRTPPATSARD